MASKIDDKITFVLESQKNGITKEEITYNLGFSSEKELKAFMSEQGYKFNKGVFTKKSTASKAKKNTEEKVEEKKLEKDPNVEKVLDLQIYNMPIFKISMMLDMPEHKIDKMMEDHGYIKQFDKYIVKPKPSKIPKKTKVRTTKTKKKKEKTKKQLLEEEYKRNPAKRGKFDIINQVQVINIQLVEIIELQLQNKTIGEIAKHMKMTKPALIEFMNEKEYILEDGKFVEERKSKAFKEQLQKIDEEIRLKKANRVPKERICNSRKEKVVYTEEEFEVLLHELEEVYNWYLKFKNHPVFEQ